MVVSRVGIQTSNIFRCQIPLGQPAAPPGGQHNDRCTTTNVTLTISQSIQMFVVYTFIHVDIMLLKERPFSKGVKKWSTYNLIHGTYYSFTIMSLSKQSMCLMFVKHTHIIYWMFYRIITTTHPVLKLNTFQKRPIRQPCTKALFLSQQTGLDTKLSQCFRWYVFV